MRKVFSVFSRIKLPSAVRKQSNRGASRPKWDKESSLAIETQSGTSKTSLTLLPVIVMHSLLDGLEFKSGIELALCSTLWTKLVRERRLLTIEGHQQMRVGDELVRKPTPVVANLHPWVMLNRLEMLSVCISRFSVSPGCSIQSVRLHNVEGLTSDQLVSFLNCCPRLWSLSLSSLTISGKRDTVELMSCYSEMKELDFKAVDCEDGDWWGRFIGACPKLVKLGQECTALTGFCLPGSLEVLRLGGWPTLKFQPDVVDRIQESCPRLKELELFELGIEGISLELAFLERLSCRLCTQLTKFECVRGCPCLELLDLYGCYRLTELAFSSQSLKSLDIACTGVEGDENIQKLITGCPQIRDLRLGGLPVEHLILQSDRLQILDMSGCANVTDFCIQAILDHCPNIRSLNLEGCHLLQFLSVESERLVELDLTGTNLPEFVLASIAQHCPNLTTFLRPIDDYF